MDSKTIFVFAFVLAFAASFFYFFPAFYTSIDEHEYLKNAQLLLLGQVKNPDPLDYCGGILRGDDYVSSYLIGKSVSLAPFLLLPFPFVMASGLIIHLINVILFFLILKKLKQDTRFTVLFILFPAFVWGSRTLFSELFALTFLLAGTLLYLDENNRKKTFLAGLLFGLAAIVRYETILISLSFAIGLGYRERKQLFEISKNKLIPFAIGGLISAALLFLWNNYYFSSPVSTTFGTPTWILSNLTQPLFLSNLLLFIAILLIAYPLMLLGTVFSKKLQIELVLSSAAYLILFSQFTNISVFQFFSPLTITARMRYFIPLAGLLLIPYCILLQNVIENGSKRFSFLNLKNFFVAAGLILLIGSIAIHAAHQGLLQNRAAVFEQIQTEIPSNSLVIGSSDDCIYFLKGVLGERKYARIDSNATDAKQLFENSTLPVYVLNLRYSNTSDSSVRQGTIDSERQQIIDFIGLHRNDLTLVYSAKSPHYLEIYSKNS